METVPLAERVIGGQTYFSGEIHTDVPDIPECIFLAGFDPLMLGYQKTENPFLPPEHLRGIFNLAGIVMPAVLWRGRVIGRWKKTGRKLTITPFEALPQTETIRLHALHQWPELTKIEVCL